MNDLIKEVIILDRLLPEYLIALHAEPIISFRNPEDSLPDVEHVAYLVYKPRYQESKNTWLYQYVGVRIK